MRQRQKPDHFWSDNKELSKENKEDETAVVLAEKNTDVFCFLGDTKEKSKRTLWKVHKWDKFQINGNII